jgi:transposase InsO family protein
LNLSSTCLSAFTDALREAGLTVSIGTVGDALDNAFMESGLFKTEGHRARASHLELMATGRTGHRILGPLVQHRTAALLDR